MAISRSLRIGAFALLLVSSGASVSSQVADDPTYNTFVKWVQAQPDSVTWDHEEELSRYKQKLGADGLSELQADAIVSALDKRVWADEAAFWDKNYDSGSVAFDPEPNQTLVRAIQGRRPGRALDVEMGQGRNAIFLARQGWSVTGFDISQKGLALAQEQARKLGVPITTVLAKDTDFDFGKDQWDLIAMIYPMEKRSLVKVADALKPGGLIVVEGFHEEVRGPARRFRTNELLDRFHGFRIYRYEEVLTKPDWGKSDARVVKFVAEKPLGK